MKKKILYINYSLGMGGIETLIFDIAKNLDKNKFIPSVCVFESAGALREEFLSAGIPVHVLPKGPGFDPVLSLRIAKLAKKEGIDLIHTHNQTSWLYGGIAALLAGVPLVHTEHTTADYHNYHTRRWMFIERVLAKFTSVITTVAGSVKKFMSEVQGIPEKKIRVIYNGINYRLYDSSLDKTAAKQELGIEPDTIIVGNVARFYAHKDHETLVRAFNLVLRKFSNAKLVLVGDGPLKKPTEKIVDSLGIGANVIFLGNRRDVPRILNAFDVFVLPSLREGLPIVLLEAMAAGVPVIASDVDGNNELVRDGENGVIVPCSKPDAVAMKVINLFKNKEKMHEMVVAARETVIKNFSFETMLKKYEEVYSDSTR